MTVKVWNCELCQLTTVIGDGWIRLHVELKHGKVPPDTKCPVEICPDCQSKIVALNGRTL